MTAISLLVLLAPSGCATGESAGDGQGGDGDGGPAAEADLADPEALAVGPDGELYIADASDNRVRVIDAEGTIGTLAGSGQRGFSGDRGPALEARLFRPNAVAVDGEGGVLIADFGNHRVRRVDSQGTITTVAGTGQRGFSGDGGPAVEAELAEPGALAVDGAGSVFVADLGNGRVRRIDASGVITTVAGTGSSGYSGDAGPAVEARLAFPRGLAVDAGGNLYIADSGNHRVRRVGPEGAITTVVGTGHPRDAGDGGPALAADLASPVGLAVDAGGNLYIADSGNHRLRRVDASGTITTVAGTGTPGPTRSGGPAVEAKLRLPGAVATGPRGDVYLVSSLELVLRIDRSGVLTRVASA